MVNPSRHTTIEGYIKPIHKQQPNVIEKKREKVILKYKSTIPYYFFDLSNQIEYFLHYAVVIDYGSYLSILAGKSEKQQKADFAKSIVIPIKKGIIKVHVKELGIKRVSAKWTTIPATSIIKGAAYDVTFNTTHDLDSYTLIILKQNLP